MKSPEYLVLNVKSAHQGEVYMVAYTILDKDGNVLKDQIVSCPMKFLTDSIPEKLNPNNISVPNPTELRNYMRNELHAYGRIIIVVPILTMSIVQLFVDMRNDYNLDKRGPNFVLEDHVLIDHSAFTLYGPDLGGLKNYFKKVTPGVRKSA